MADHIRLLPTIPLPTKRTSSRFDPDAPPFDRQQQATTLRGLLEGLASHHEGVFVDQSASDETSESEEEELDAAHMGEIVLKITGHMPFASGAFKQWNMTPVAAGGGKQFFVLSDAASRAAFHAFAGSYSDDPDAVISVGAWRDVLENISGIELYDVDDRLSSGFVPPRDNEILDIDVVLWPTSIATQGAEKEGRRRVASIRALIDDFAKEDSRVSVLAFDDTHPDTLLVHVRVNTVAFEALANNSLVERLRAPLAVEVFVKDLSNSANPSSTLLPEGAPIGVIDDLVVDANPWLSDVIVEQRSFPDGHIFGDHTAHGTQVAGIAAWGNIRKLLDEDFDGQPHPIYVARVAQMNDQYDAQIVGNAADQISDALDWLAQSGVKIVVLALGENHPDDGAIPSDLASVVDRKVRELDLVVVTSAGNVVDISGHWKHDYPDYLRAEESKVAAPGSAALAVTVGSVNHTLAFDRKRWPNGIAIAGVGESAPYSRTGPSRGSNVSGRQKPEFVAHGGGWAFDQGTSNLIVDDANLAATTLIPPVNGRNFGSSTGTSYAAPRVAHEIARIQTRYPNAGANLLRALTALGGDPPPKGMLKESDLLSGIYGIPRADRVLESTKTGAIFVYEGEMKTNSHAVLEIPIPSEFAAGYSDREIRVALAFDPPVQRSRRDYIAGRMRFEFLQKESLNDIRNAYATQPTAAERALDPKLSAYPSLSGREMDPPRTRLSADTLICRTFRSPREGWDEDDHDYHLVVTHDHSPWSQSQKNGYQDQRFAVAIHLIDHVRNDIDLHALAEARLIARARARGGSE